MQEQEINKELHKEFQVERMILFSDAVFAIVITLMAIEIKLPEHSELSIGNQLLNLLPTFICYAISFLFIGSIWYRHLKVFGLLKAFDKKLVIINLLMLFFIGLFPFAISVITKSSNMAMPAIIIYLSIIACCKASQVMLEHYILIKNPVLRIQKDVTEEVRIYKENRIAFISLLIVSTLTITTFLIIPNQEKKGIAWVWFSLLPILIKLQKKKISKKK